MKYPQFAATLRALAPTLKGIADRIGRSERQVAYYLAGNAMPSADIIVRVPELHEALRRDLSASSADDPNKLLIAA